jgi:hypothetical protein
MSPAEVWMMICGCLLSNLDFFPLLGPGSSPLMLAVTAESSPDPQPEVIIRQAAKTADQKTFIGRRIIISFRGSSAMQKPRFAVALPEHSHIFGGLPGNHPQTRCLTQCRFHDEFATLRNWEA